MHDAKTHLSRYVAELTPGSIRKAAKPRIGVAKGKLIVPDSFFEPLPKAILKSFQDE